MALGVCGFSRLETTPCLQLKLKSWIATSALATSKKFSCDQPRAFYEITEKGVLGAEYGA